MSEFNKYSTDGGATFIDVEDSEAVHYGDQSKGYVGKNHLHITQPSISNLGGVKVTVNSDGSVTFNGTATSNNSFSLTDWTENLFPEGDYLLSDVNGQAGKIFTFIARKKGTSGVVDNTIDTHAMQNKPFTVDYTEYDYYKVSIYFFSGQTFNNLTIYPMIRLASIPDNTYEPYLTPNTEIPDKMSYADNSQTGVHNFVKTPYNGQKDNVDVTVTVDDDGVININGTQGSTDGQYFLSNRFAYDLRIKKGKYVITGGSVDLALRCAKNKTTGRSSAGGQSIGDEKGSGLAINADTDIDLQIIVIIKANTTFNDVKVYPLLRLASDTDTTYAPYAMTNRELTDKVQGIINAATNAADFAAFKTAIGNL